MKETSKNELEVLEKEIVSGIDSSFAEFGSRVTKADMEENVRDKFLLVEGSVSDETTLGELKEVEDNILQAINTLYAEQHTTISQSDMEHCVKEIFSTYK